MDHIKFNLRNACCLDCFAAPDGGGTVIGPPMSGEGIYMIINQGYEPANRYMGISTDLYSRFKQREAVIFELGIPQSGLKDIYALWGDVSYIPADDNEEFATSYASGETTITIQDCTYDFEQVFIRAALSMFGGSITNTAKTDPVVNQSGCDIQITFGWPEDEWVEKTDVWKSGTQL